MQVEDQNYPVGVCSDCKELVTATFILKVKYDQTTITLRNCFSSLKKEEKNEDILDQINESSDLGNSDIENENGGKQDLKNYQNYVEKESKMVPTSIKIDKQECSDLEKTNGKQEMKKEESNSFMMDNKSEENVSVKTEKFTEITTKVSVQQQNSLGHVHVCPICLKELASALDLRQHAHTHKTLKSYLKGEKVLNNSVFVANYLETVSIFYRPEIIHKCPTCKEDLPIEKFYSHVNNHRIQEDFGCDKCDRIFRKISHLNIHKVRAHLEEYPFKCEACNKGFVIKRNYDCHLLTHTETELPHKCEYCSRSFSNPEHLHRHLFIHTENISYGIKYKVNRCYFCKRSFKSIEQLMEHREKCRSKKAPYATHRIRAPRITSFTNSSESKEFKCPLCPRSYHFIEGLESHTRRIHKSNENSKILCAICGKSVSNIFIHMAGHAENKPYKCDLCPKTFTTKTVLRQHLLVHSGEKPFVCSSCGKAFNNYYNLQVHERIHKGDRCHKCVICGRGFLEKSYLNKHMRTHRKN